MPEGRSILQTLRSHEQHNTTVYGLDDPYHGITSGRRVLFVNGRALESIGPTPVGNVASYYPETNPWSPSTMWPANPTPRVQGRHHPP